MSERGTSNGEWPGSAAVIGGGTMGLGIAAALAVAGVPWVRLLDATPELSVEAHDALLRRVRGHVESGLLPEEAALRAESVEAATDVAEAVGDAGLVFEAVPERLDLKLDTLAAVAGNAPEGAVITTNTSSLPVDELAGAVGEAADRFLGVHWFNPAEWTPGVEVIPAVGTAPAVVERVMAFLRGIGKRPAVVGSGPGFVANRIQMALFREALACVEDGLATPAEVDEVVRSCFGFRLPFFGPFGIADMAGLDVYASIFETLERGLGEGFRPPEALRRMVEEGRVGTKVGEGFFDYPDGERERLLLERDRRYAALGALLSELPPYGETGREG